VATKFVTNLDLNQNQILNGKFEVLASDPSSNNFEGRMIYNSTEDTIKVYSGSAWRKMLHSVTSGGTYSSYLSVSESNGAVTLTISGTSDATATSIVARDENSQIKVAATPTDNAHAASKGYVDSAISGATVSTEQVQDIVGAQLVTNGSHSGITASYDDAGDGAIDLTLDATYSPTFAGLTINGASITFEGATADAYETTLTVTDPTADRTLTLPNATDTLVGKATQDTFTNKTFDTAGAGNSFSVNGNAITSYVGSGNNVVLSSNPTITNLYANGLTVTGASIVIEGATDDIYETTLTVVDPTADRTITLPNVDGTVVTTGNLSAITSLGVLTTGITFEGATADEYETTLTVTDPTADRTITLPDVDGTVITTGNLSSITSVGTLSSLTITGDLTVNGTTTTVNSTTVTVDDKNIELGSTATPSDAGADGGGITLKGTTDKTFSWVDSTDAWTSSEHLNLASGKVYMINGTTVLSGSALGSGVTSSSLTSVGTITTGVWNGTDIAVADGGTGASDAAGAKTNLGFMTRYAANVGDGSNTSYTVTHNLGTRDVIVQIHEVASPYAVVIADIAATTTSAVTIAFATAPTTDQYRVVVIG
jgi:hypothetical protein